MARPAVARDADMLSELRGEPVDRVAGPMKALPFADIAVGAQWSVTTTGSRHWVGWAHCVMPPPARQP